MLRLNKSLYNSFKINILSILEEVEKDNTNFKGFYKSFNVEDVFKNINNCFSIRPIFLKKEERINSHMLIYLFALLFTKIIYLKLNKEYSINNIQECIQKFRLSECDGNNYMKFKGINKLIKEITEILNIPLGNKYIKGDEVRKIFGNVKKK